MSLLLHVVYSRQDRIALARVAPCWAYDETLCTLYIPPAVKSDTYYSAPDRGADYCDERVCLSVCLSVRDHIFGTTRPIFTNFLCMLHMAVAWSSSGSVVICYGMV